MSAFWNSIENSQGLLIRLFRWLVIVVGAFLGFQFISLYLSWPKQAVLGAVTIVVAISLGRFSKSYLITLALMIMSMVATLRYGWWRIHLVIDFFVDSSNRRLQIDSVFLLILLSAEIYAFAIMFLGYLQMAWPLHRKPVPLPDDIERWPHVDLLIPTYNEPLSIVRYTALAAMGIDYPPEKLHVYILDDGRREDFRAFAEEAGVGYIRRTDNKGAKAGNINRALEKLTSPYVAIFDCDHVPTRSFLQVTVGWFLRDERLGMLQTPHHFYSPDPFERNLGNFRVIPNEGELFYGIVQDGNDFWNATFFCGSCAVLRRDALNEVGGVRTETVTEDAHTSLRLQMRGWNTAYLNLPQAAGLATESLSAHIGQRIRWARGMIQILRTDNPLFARGLKFTQRICYFNAMFHFMYAVPRLVFLLAPLVYMLLGRSIIPGFWAAILVYALPHLVLSNMANSRIQGRHRHSFWNEIYETVLAPYILAPTLLALINPKLGKFNVTDKGGVVEDSYFDSQIARPTTWLLLLNLLGVAVAPYRMFIKDPDHPGTVILNLVWIVFNIVILGAAGAVALEAQQRRGTVRISAAIPVSVSFPDGSQFLGESVDLSAGGASICMNEPMNVTPGQVVHISFLLPDGDAELSTKVVGNNDKVLRLEFQCPTIPEQEVLTRVIYSRADAWLGSTAEPDRPLRSLWRIVRLSNGGIKQLLLGLLPRRQRAAQTKPASTVAAILFCLAISFTWTAKAELAGGTPATSTLQDTVREDRPSGSFRQVLSLKTIGLSDPLDFSSRNSYRSVHLTLPSSQVVTNATLNLRYHLPAGAAGGSSLKILLNGTDVTTVPLAGASSAAEGLLTSNVELPADLLVRENTITFQFLGEDANGSTLQKTSIDPSTTFTLSGTLLSLAADLKLLPMPFYDKDLQSATTISFVFLSQPTMKALQAAGVVASWFGVQSGARPVKYSVSIGTIPAGNAIVFSSNHSELPPSLQSSVSADPTVALAVNPQDAYGQILLLSGNTDDQLVEAAQAVSSASQELVGAAAHFSNYRLPNPRRVDDAPLWLPNDRPSPLWNYGTEESLQADGSSPLAIYLRVPPDLYYGEQANLQLHLNYRYNATPLSDGSVLRIVVNGAPVNEAPLPKGQGMKETSRWILFPVAAMRPSSNTFQFNFVFNAPFGLTQDKMSPLKLKGEILRNSSLNVQGLVHWAAMPNLELFANAGFPFTRLADLADTTVVVPNHPSREQLSLFLLLMSHFSAQTGYPALRVTVAGPESLGQSDRDYLVLGNIGQQPAFETLQPFLPVSLTESGLRAQQSSGALVIASRWWDRLLNWIQDTPLAMAPEGDASAMIEGIQSPYGPDHSVVVVVLKNDFAVDGLSDEFLARSQSSDISGSISVFDGSHFSSSRLESNSYHLGAVSRYVAMRIWLAQNFLVLLLSVTAVSLLLSLWARSWLRRHAEWRLRLAVD